MKHYVTWVRELEKALSDCRDCPYKERDSFGTWWCTKKAIPLREDHPVHGCPHHRSELAKRARG